MSRVLVTGGTGYLGRHVVSSLLEAGYTVRIMSRSAQPAHLEVGSEWAQASLESGEGLAEAVGGCDVIVHAASDPRHGQEVDVVGTQRLLVAARAAGIAHIVYISIVGIDRIPFAYYRYKLAVEKLIEEGGVPWSVLRATQFHEFVDLLLRSWIKLPLVALIPTDFKVQPVDAAEVARRLCELVGSGPSGRAPDFGGPEVLTLGTMARSWLAARGIRRVIVPLRLPGGLARGMRAGDNTCPNEPLHGQVTWTQWLQRQVTKARGGQQHAIVR